MLCHLAEKSFLPSLCTGSNLLSSTSFKAKSVFALWVKDILAQHACPTTGQQQLEICFRNCSGIVPVCLCIRASIQKGTDEFPTSRLTLEEGAEPRGMIHLATCTIVAFLKAEIGTVIYQEQGSKLGPVPN